MRLEKQVYNPYLPLGTCIPDGEPHVFGDRLYVYGSHDQEGGSSFCVLDYECWSTPVDDLTSWRCEGTIYRAEQDPDYGTMDKVMYAPDVVRGTDGRYYLYYAMAGGKRFTGPIHVAVCDTPAGKYEYYGSVRTPDGKEMEKYITFDPGILNDNGRIWLYYGWALSTPPEEIPDPEERMRLQTQVFGKTREELTAQPECYMGANAVVLADDMLTILNEPVRIVPGPWEAVGTSFEGHAFFEASSMRKVRDTYYFIYSSQHSHELCYAVSKYPDRDFVYGGTIISNGDIGYQGRAPEDRLATTGNNHGSIVEIKGQWYIFYHRQTHKTIFSRQGCAEPIQILPDGSILQVEMTICGLNGGPLEAQGEYPAPICCNLTNSRMPQQGLEPITVSLPHVTNCRECRYIAEINSGTVIGYKYFRFDGKHRLNLRLRGEAEGTIYAAAGEIELGCIPVSPSADWREAAISFDVQGVHPLYFRFEGTGQLDIERFAFEKTI